MPATEPAPKPAIAPTVPTLREHVAEWRRAGETVALVPTMGALHDGHASLIRQAASLADRVVMSLFVNPAQFGPNEDFTRYPRTFEADCAKAAAAGADLVFAPGVEDMYPAGFATTISLDGPAKAGLEDRFRPTHFDGVATVCAKLFIQSGADVALFGEKDWQQLQVVTRLARDLDLPIRIVPAPTVREPDGLAMSSRNRYLAPEDRARAPALARALNACAAAIRAGQPIQSSLAAAITSVEAAGFQVDYIEAREPASLAPVADGAPSIRLLAAARLGTTRLIDNIPV